MCETETVYVVDRREQMPAKTSAYALLSTCRNCGERHVSLLAHGKAPVPADPDDRCPYCLCGGKVHYGTMRDAKTLLSGREIVNWYDDPRDGFIISHIHLDLGFSLSPLLAAPPLPKGVGVYDKP